MIETQETILDELDELKNNLGSLFEKHGIREFEGYAEPGRESNQPVLLGDFNHVDQKDQDFLEQMGYELEWEDEWIECYNCYKIFRIVPNSYSWQMSGAVLEGEALCADCLTEDPGDYIETFLNNPTNAITYPVAEKFDLEHRGFTKLDNSNFHAGWYDNRNDDPKEILAGLLEKNPSGKYLFVLTGQGQFEISFTVYELDKEIEDEEDLEFTHA